MIKNFDKNKVEVMDYGPNGHYPIPLEKDIYCNYICIDDDLMPSPYKID